MKTKLILFVPTLITLSFNLLNLFQVGNEEKVDFKDDHEKAQDWGFEMNHNWMKKLTNVEKSAIFDYTSTSYRSINRYLRYTKGEIINNDHPLSKDPNFLLEFPHFEELNKQTMILDQAIDKSTLSHTLNVYRFQNETSFDLDLNSLWIDQTSKKINSDLAQQIKKNFLNKQFTNPSFLSTSLTNTNYNLWISKSPILLQMTLNKGSKAAFLGAMSHYPSELEVLLARKNLFEYKTFSIINQKTMQLLKIVVKMIKR